jgi:hypothetical protein
VQERDIDGQAIGDLAHTVVEHRVAGDPEHTVLLTVPAEGEAHHVAGEQAAERRAMATRRRSDPDLRPSRRFERRSGPRLESTGASAEPSCA